MKLFDGGEIDLLPCDVLFHHGGGWVGAPLVPVRTAGTRESQCYVSPCIRRRRRGLFRRVGRRDRPADDAANRRLLIEDVYTHPKFYRGHDQATGYRTKSMIAVPLKVGDRVTGVAQVINRLDDMPFDSDDLDLFIGTGKIGQRYRNGEAVPFQQKTRQRGLQDQFVAHGHIGLDESGKLVALLSPRGQDELRPTRVFLGE